MANIRGKIEKESVLYQNLQLVNVSKYQLASFIYVLC